MHLTPVSPWSRPGRAAPPTWGLLLDRSLENGLARLVHQKEDSTFTSNAQLTPQHAIGIEHPDIGACILPDRKQDALPHDSVILQCATYGDDRHVGNNA